MIHRFALAMLALCIALPGAAQDVQPAPAQPVLGFSDDSGWVYTVAPYLFASGLSGRVDTFGTGQAVEVDQGFSELVQDLRLGGMVAGNARKGRWGVSGDLQYINLAPGFDTAGPAFDGGELTAKQTILSLQGEYVLAETDRANLIGLAGARWWSVDTTIRLNAGTQPSQTAQGADSWIDPVIGLRGRYDLSDRWFVTGWGMAGGFGAGSDSMSDLFGAVGYRFSGRSSAVLGYRWLSVDRETDDFLYDITMDGIMAGVSFGF